MAFKKIKVVIADDHPLLRIGIRQILEKSTRINIVGEAENGKEAIRLVDECSPDVLILDLQMPVMDGFEVLEILHRTKRNLIILILSANNDNQLISELLGSGAWGYYLKEEAPTIIVDAIHQAVVGNGKGYRPGLLVK